MLNLKKVIEMKTTDFAIYLSKYLTFYLLNERGCSPQTIDSYRHAFILYLEYMENRYSLKPEKIAVKDFTKKSIVDFLHWLEIERKNSATTCNYRLSALKGFVHYLKYEFPDYMEEYQHILGIPFKKTIHKEISYMKTDGVRLLINQIDLNSKNGLRDYMILLILYTTGIRVSELVNIKVKDISLTEPCTVLVHGKGNKSRYVPLIKKTLPFIEKYLTVMNYNDEVQYDEYLFKNHMHTKFTRQGINYIIKKYSDKARCIDATLVPRDLTAHKIRHTTAMEMITSGVDLMYIRDLLGHSSITTTEIYARTDADMKRKAIEAASKEILPQEEAKWDNNLNLKEWLKSYNKH